MSGDYGVAPYEVTFTNTSEGEYETSYWEFGDGTSSNQENPVHSYKKSGIYDVTLIVNNDQYNDTIVKTHLIRVYNEHTNDTVEVKMVPGDSLMKEKKDNINMIIGNWVSNRKIK